MKRKLREWRTQKCNPCFGAKSPPRSTRLQTIRFHAAPYWTVSANLRKVGASYRRGTGFAPIQSTYGREATGMENLLRGALSEPKQGSHFWVLHSRSFPSICRLDWCKPGTSAIGSPDFPQICTHGPIRRCMKPDSLQARTARWAFCTKTSIAFLGSPFP